MKDFAFDSTRREIKRLEEIQSWTIKVYSTTSRVAFGEIALADPTAGALAINLPLIGQKIGQQIIIKNNSSSTNTITISCHPNNTIDGSSTTTITSARGVKHLISTNTGWVII